MNNLLHFKRSSTTRAGVTKTVEIAVGPIFGWLVIVVVLAVAGKLVNVSLPADLHGIMSIVRSLAP